MAMLIIQLQESSQESQSIITDLADNFLILSRVL